MKEAWFYKKTDGAFVIEQDGFSVTRVELAAGSKCLDCGKKIPIVGKAQAAAAA